MNTKTRFRLVAVVAVTVALATAGTAAAAWAKLTPPPGSSSGASGTAHTSWDGPYGEGGWTSWVADTRFQVRGLKPNTRYLFQVFDTAGGGWNVFFDTDKRGAWGETFQWESFAPQSAHYYVYDETDALVLFGSE